MTDHATEVIVYGATSAGVCAAVAAAERGAQVTLLEPREHVGGMTSGGLGYTDVGDTRVLGGMAARLRTEIGRAYGVAPGHYAGPEPHVAERIYRDWLAAAGVDVRFGEPLSSVIMADEVIEAVITPQGTYRAGVFVDASYEGDLLAAAGVPYAIGREDRALHGEEFAGRQELVPGRHAMPSWISPFVDDVEGYDAGPLLPQVKTGPLVAVGEGDGGVMSYGYRLCLTTAADRIPVVRRDGYDESHWELGRRLFRHWEQQGTVPPAGRLIGLEQNLPNGKCDANSLDPFSLSVLDGSAWEYPDAEPMQREEIRLHHLHHAQDFLYFLGNDRAVPSSIRREIQRWGLPADEFVDTDHLPHQLYVREARRMIGDHVLTEHDVRGAKPQPDVIALGSYHLDVREVQRTWRWVHEHPRPIGMIFTEGYLSVPVPPYPIPYRSLLPLAEDCTNLIVPVCVSASQVAFSSVRMEVQYQMLGHAAGLAAALAVGAGTSVQQVCVNTLQDGLTHAGQTLAL